MLNQTTIDIDLSQNSCLHLPLGLDIDASYIKQLLPVRVSMLCTVQKFGVVWLPKLASGFRVFYTTKRTVYHHSVYYFHLPGQLKPDYRGPPSSQGASGPAPSSTSLQEKLSMS